MLLLPEAHTIVIWGAVGAGVTPHTLVRVIGTSTCDVMVASYDEIGTKCIKGICGQVDGSVIPGMVGLEAGQSSFGDVYAMFRRILEFPVREILPQTIGDKLSKEEIDNMFQCYETMVEVPVKESLED